MKSRLYTLLTGLLLMACEMASSDRAASPSPGGSSGTGGSMARFAVAGNQLYTVSHSNLRVFDATNSADPKMGVTIPLGVGVETIFPYNRNLFIGTMTGMYIFDISTPDKPKQLSHYQHIVSCDPVVAQGRYAYVTLRSGTPCGGGINTLDVVDISDLAAPKLLRRYPMTNPHGLGIDGNLLFICEGDHGLKVYDATNPLELKLIQEFRQVRSYDVIPKNNVLIVTATDGIYQYSYTNQKELKLLSTILIEN